MPKVGQLFEDSLLIVKADYMHKRKPVLLMLLQERFQIQGRRRVNFSPEQAAEFYNDMQEDHSFMLHVILLSKGNAEAFVLTREDCVNELLKTMICYFTTSDEMERNVHVSKTTADVRREIQFIFPNYIHEPIPDFDRYRFCKLHDIGELIGELYEIVKGGEDNIGTWRQQLATWMEQTNKNLPQISNLCSRKQLKGSEEKGVQVTIPEPVVSPRTMEDRLRPRRVDEKPQVQMSTPTFSVTSAHSSGLISSSSCVSCTGFGGEPVHRTPPTHSMLAELLKSKTQALPRKPPTPPPTICDVNWREASDQGTDHSRSMQEQEEEEDWDGFDAIDGDADADGTAIAVEDMEPKQDDAKSEAGEQHSQAAKQQEAEPVLSIKEPAEEKAAPPPAPPPAPAPEVHEEPPPPPPAPEPAAPPAEVHEEPPAEAQEQPQ